MTELKTDPTPREVQVFGLLWLLFFALVSLIVVWRPEGLVGAATFLGIAWVVSLIFNPDDMRRQLAGALLPGVFGAAGLAATNGAPPIAVIAPLAGVGLLGALTVWFAPALGKRLFVGWMIAGLPIGWTISHLVLAAVYFFVLTPIGLIMRLAGRDTMNRTPDPKATTYWIQRKGQTAPERYFRQF